MHSVRYWLANSSIPHVIGTVYHFRVIRRLYVNNFRCLQNFELPIGGLSSALLIGKNGAGKTTISLALEILQKIACGTNRVGDLVRPTDISRGSAGIPIRFEIEVELNDKVYSYLVAFEFPEGFRELRVHEEKLSLEGKSIYSREVAQVHLSRAGQEANFMIDWHLVALPVIQFKSNDDPLLPFKQWLSRTLILRPIPALMSGDSEDDTTLRPNPLVTNYGAWFSGVVADAPSVYVKMIEYLKEVMPDLIDIKNPKVAQEARSLVVQFSNGQTSVTFPLKDLAEGEKCFLICALVLATNDAHGPLLCFWDEPDNYLALDEVGHFVLALRKAFQTGGQFIATSHNPEAIRRFSDESTLFLYRRNHLEPTIVRPLSELQVKGDLVGALIRGDVEPQQ